MMAHEPSFEACWRRTSAIRITALLSVLLILCMALPSAAQNTLRIFETRDVDGYDPFTLNGVESFRLMGLIFAPMVELNAKREVENRLADTIIQDGRVWTIRLKSGVSFAEGDLFTHGNPKYREVTAADVERTYQTFINPKTEIQNPTFSGLLKRYVDDIQVVNDTTLRVRFKSDVKPNAAALIFPIAPKRELPKAYITRDPDPSTGEPVDFIRYPYGAGYYYIDEVRGTRVWQLSKNKGLPQDDIAHIDNLHFVVQPNYDSEINDFVQGNFTDPICIPDVPPEKIAQFKDNSYHDLHELRALRYSYVAFNLESGPLADLNVRRALSCAIDRKQLLSDYQSQGHPVTGPFPYDSPERCDTCPTPYQVYNPLLADSLLEAAGWAKQPSGWRVNAQGVRLEITLTTYSETRNVAARVAERIKGYWEGIGVKTEDLPLPFHEYLERVFRRHDFDAAFGKWEFASSADPFQTFHSTGKFNFISYEDPVVDSLLLAVYQVRKDSAIFMYHQLHAKIANQAPYAFLHTINRRAVVTNLVDIGPNIEHWNFLRRINLWRIP
jgi:peptide/nickel transport system substrate-binding protein